MRRAHRPTIQVYANFQDPSSIGRVARAVANHLAVVYGNDLAITCTTGMYPHNVPGTNVRHALDAQLAVFVGFPKQSERILQMHGRVLGLYVCEGDIVTTPWVAACNRHVGVVVPSDYCRRAFVDSGVTVPVDVVRHGVAPDFQLLEDVKRRDVFTFLAVFAMTQWWPRKGVAELLAAFARFRQVVPTSELLIKTNPHPQLDGWLTLPGVTWITIPYSDLDMARLYASAHFHVHPSRGEGFGLTPLESLCCGTPVVVPNHTGLTEYVDPARDVVIQVPDVKVDCETYDNPVGRLRTMSADGLLDAMLRAYREREARAAAARAFDASAWRWPAVLRPLAAAVEAALRSGEHRFVAGACLEPVLTTEPEIQPVRRTGPTGRRERLELRLYMSRRQAQDYRDDPTGLGVVVRELAARLPVTSDPFGSVLLCPYNPEHCDFQELSRRAPVVAYTTFESDRWPPHWVEQLNHCVEVVVPQRWVASALRASGCTRPIKVIPQGFKQLPPVPPRQRRRDRPFTFGFLGVPVKRKGLDLLVRCLPPNCRLLVRAAWWPNGVTPPADPRVSLLAGRLSDEELHEKFWREIDCLAFPSSGEGYSMVPREAIAMGVPCLVSDIPAHADVDCLKVATRPGFPAYYEFCGRTVGDWYEVDERDLRAKLAAVAAGRLRHKDACARVTWDDAVAQLRATLGSRLVTYCPRRDAGGGIDRFARRLAACWPELTYAVDEGDLATPGHGIEWLILQFEYGLYAASDLERLAAVKAAEGFRVLAIVHSANQCTPEVHSNAALAALADRLVLLNPAQAAAFPTGTYVEHPWPEPGAYREVGPDAPLGTHGFIHRQKGYRHLFAVARALDRTVRIAGKLAAHDHGIMQTYREQIRDLATPADQIDLRFVPDAEMERKMGDCAALLYCYEPWRNVQATGAVRDAVRFGRPALVSAHADYMDMPAAAFPRLTLEDLGQMRRATAAVLADPKAWFDRQADHARRHGWTWFVEQLRALTR